MPTTVVKSRSWRPLAFPSTALIHNGNENQMFPLHRAMLTVVLRELLILDGTLDSSTLALTPQKLVLHRNLHNRETRLMSRVEGHLARNWQACPAPPKIESRKKNRSRHRSNEEFSSRKRRRCTGQSKIIAGKAITQFMSTSSEGSLPSSIECTSGEELVAILLTRCSDAWIKTTPDMLLQLSANNDFASPPENTSAQPPRTRKVSDLDMMDSENRTASKKPVNADPMANANDICQFCILFPESYSCRGLFQLTHSNLPSLLEAGIQTESRLRSIALVLCRHIMQSFSDESLLKFLGYKSPLMNREKCLMPLVADYLFATSHALFAWEATQREILLGADGRTPAQRDSYIKETLFDARTLETLGGWEWSSLFHQAVHLLDDSSLTPWESWARTKQGRRALAHHKSAEASTRVALKRRHGKRRVRLPNQQTSSSPTTAGEDISQGQQRSRSFSVSSQGSDLQPLDVKRTQILAERAVPSTTTVRLERRAGQSWGILLSREGDMCVVERGSSRPRNDLRSGDVIIQAENEEGTTARVFYRPIVDLFKKSDRLTLRIQRVNC